MTTYTILYKPESPTNGVTAAASAGWQKLPKEYEAGSNTAAVRLAAAETNKGGSYVAIPVRSFEVIRIEIETNPRVKVVKGA